jgi:hypothetical protein
MTFTSERLRRAVDLIIDLPAEVVELTWTLVLRYRAFFFSLTVTLVFYTPSLINNSRDAGFIYTGDVLGFYWPSLQKVQHLLSQFIFTGIDISQFNGSSDFFLTPNFFGVEPFFVVYSLFSSLLTPNAADIGHVLVIVLAIHSFLACYFAIKLLTRFFFFDFSIATFAAIAFAFNVAMLSAHGEPQFVFCAAVIPWAAYAALDFDQRRTLSFLPIASLPMLLAFLAGYVPLGVGCLLLAAGIVAGKLLLFDTAPLALRQRVHRVMIAAAPFICAAIVVSPYLIAVYLFVQASPSGTTASLFYSAHQLAELPQSILRLFSASYSVPGPFYEFSLHWGLAAVTITALFLMSLRSFGELSLQEWGILKFSAAIYFATILSIYGTYSAVSDLVYYFIPQVGGMHIYQRFLLGANFLLGVMVALMLKALLQLSGGLLFRIGLAILAVLTLLAAFLVARTPSLAETFGLNNQIVFELMLSFLLVFALILPGTAFKTTVILVLFMLPALTIFYSNSHGNNRHSEQIRHQGILIDGELQRKVSAYFRKNSDKNIVKYVDITPLWKDEIFHEVFSKTFPYLILRHISLSSYGGFNFYLSSRADYMKLLPVIGKNQVRPNWKWLAKTGADFVVALNSDVDSLKEQGFIPEADGASYRLPNEVVILPLTLDHIADRLTPDKLFDNGYFRVFSVGSRGGSLENIAVGKPARQSSTFGDAVAGRAVDGVRKGDFRKGSIAHTEVDPHAFLEIDLGTAEPIAKLRIWNRTDCCADRLRNYWILISETPFADSETPKTMSGKPGVWSWFGSTPDHTTTIFTGGARGRYVRLQFDDDEYVPDRYLSVAEIEVFRAADPPPAEGADSVSLTEQPLKVVGFDTNNANYFRLDVDSTVPAVVEYQFFPNPRLSYSLNGKAIKPGKRGGLTNIKIPAGISRIEIRYRHSLLTVFWVVYGLFGLACLWSLIMEIVRTIGGRRRLTSRGI